MTIDRKALLCCLILLFAVSFQLAGQSKSVARRWNESLLFAIKSDLARPTVHARNLFHTAVALYDAWAAYDNTASTYFLNHSFRGYYCTFTGVPQPTDVEAAREEAMSYAAYRLMEHRFKNSPGATPIKRQMNLLMAELGFDVGYTSVDYENGPPAALGNYIASQLITWGLRDGANEANEYKNRYYTPINSYLYPDRNGNPVLEDPNRWQPLSMEVIIDQGGRPLTTPPAFLSPEWGKVAPFAMQESELKIQKRNGHDYWLYHDPGPPPLLDMQAGSGNSSDYLWNFALVSVWASHLDPNDGVMMDISPASTGNLQKLPSNTQELQAFYNLTEGGDPGKGYALNPKTNQPYEPQIVPRGDYARVLAEYWADGPNSETPPGHWYTILNHVSDHPLFEKRLGGQGPILNNLEWDTKAYLALGGAVHDAAISAWGIKGYYDYIRPISAIRSMAQRGQSSDPKLPAYHIAGIPLLKGYIELVEAGDALAGASGEHINKIKLYTWRGHQYITQQDISGAGWILAENWWPYQRASFVTPPFAGYVSGHSTFSRAAAEVLAQLTGDEFFPGGMSEFKAPKDRFLYFEKGPSVDLVLQWAKYVDAADQCSLSRIWGGIHPPADDIPGRIIGKKVGFQAFEHASTYFKGEVMPEPAPQQTVPNLVVYPNPLKATQTLHVKAELFIPNGKVRLLNTMGQILFEKELKDNEDALLSLDFPAPLKAGIYILVVADGKTLHAKKILVN